MLYLACILYLPTPILLTFVFYFRGQHNYTHTGYITVPQYFHRHIIGRDGVTITSIRSESGCLIHVPKDNGQVVLMGTAESIEKARKRIQEIVSRAVRTS